MSAPQAIRYAPATQREPVWLIGFGLAMFAAGSIAGVALTLFVAGAL